MTEESKQLELAIADLTKQRDAKSASLASLEKAATDATAKVDASYGKISREEYRALDTAALVASKALASAQADVATLNKRIAKLSDQLADQANISKRTAGTAALDATRKPVLAAVLQAMETHGVESVCYQINRFQDGKPLDTPTVEVLRTVAPWIARKTRGASTGGGNGGARKVYPYGGQELGSRAYIEQRGPSQAPTSYQKVLDTGVGLTHLADAIAKRDGIEPFIPSK